VETWDAIRARRDVRAFADRPIAPTDLERILEAGRRAPSASNWQPWDFVVVTDRRVLAELSKVGPGSGHVATSAATIALVAPEPETAHWRDLLHYDLGQATAYMMLAATDLGVGSAHAGVNEPDVVQRALGFPSGRLCPYLVVLGHPADRPLRPIAEPNRRPFDEVVHWERW
jgi:nitroreductase